MPFSGLRNEYRNFPAVNIAANYTIIGRVGRLVTDYHKLK